MLTQDHYYISYFNILNNKIDIIEFSTWDDKMYRRNI